MNIEDLAKRETAKRADERERNRALMKAWNPEFYQLAEDLKKAGMLGKLVMLNVEQKEAA